MTLAQDVADQKTNDELAAGVMGRIIAHRTPDGTVVLILPRAEAGTVAGCALVAGAQTPRAYGFTRAILTALYSKIEP